MISLTSICVLLMSSCDPGVYFEKIVENKSNHDLKFFIYRNNGLGANELVDSILIPKNSQSVIFKDGGIGTVDEYTYCGSYLDSITSKFVGTDTVYLKLDPNQSTNWKYIVLDKSKIGGGECECRFIFNDSDLN